MGLSMSNQTQWEFVDIYVAKCMKIKLEKRFDFLFVN
jgi:hypothetical protein